MYPDIQKLGMISWWREGGRVFLRRCLLGMLHQKAKVSVVPFQNREKVKLLRPPLDIAVECAK